MKENEDDEISDSDSKNKDNYTLNYICKIKIIFATIDSKLDKFLIEIVLDATKYLQI